MNVRIYRVRGLISVAIAIAGVATIATLYGNYWWPEDNIWDRPEYFPYQVLALITGGSWYYGLWLLFKAKGRSGWWCLFGFNPLVAAIAVLVISDKPIELATLQGLPDDRSGPPRE